MNRITLFLTVCVLAVSCVSENGMWGVRGDSGSIGVNVSGINSPVTKSSASGEVRFDSFIIDTIGGQELRLDAYVSDYNPDDIVAETKGSITNTDNIKSFWLDGYANDGWHDNETGEDYTAGQYFGKAVTKSSGAWSIADSPRWLNGVDMSFWSWAGGVLSSSPVPGLTPYDIDLTDNMASISYTNNGQTDLIYAFNKEKRVFNENTGKITSGTGTYKTGSKNAMDIKFYHALSAVRFDVSGLKNNGLTIKKVTICNVVNMATCVIAADPTVAGNPLDFVWTPNAVSLNTANFAVSFNAATDFTETGVDGTTPDALMAWNSSKFLFLIPQEVEGQGITIELQYEDSSSTLVTKTFNLNHSTAWEAGKYYTYALTVNESEVSVIVDDTVTSTLKKDVSIKNTGNKSAFVRASIVAYWMDEAGNYLSNCDYKNQGTIVGLATGSWSENTTDGFFYYEGEVEVGEDIGPSFMTSYAPAEAPISGATLRMVITAQAKLYDSTKTCYEAFNN